MPRLTVVLKIPFECEPPVGLVTALTFAHWLPIGRDQGIPIEDGDIRFVLWFDEKTTWWASQPTAAELRNHANVLARYVNVDLEVANVPMSLLSYMQHRDFTRLPTEPEKEVQAEYERLGQKILVAVLHRVNRLVAYARSQKGQYWITEYDVDCDRMSSYFNAFEARGCIDDGAWFRFQPATGDRISLSFGGESKYIAEGEWSAFRDFVMGAHKPGLVGELLAGAEYLLKAGHRRSALTEAVTALEVAIYNFARNPNAAAAFGECMAARLSVQTLQSQVKHLGLTATVGYLLPTIIPERLLPSLILSDCQSALTQRQNVVHNGQRDVEEGVVVRAIASIRTCCTTLESISDIPHE